MDEIVKAAMARWPDVPAVYGWLGLSARGEWRIRGEPIANASIREFIGRNYASDDQGNWFFQNGPQRVFVSLEATPFIYRLDSLGHLQAHTGARPRELRAAFADPEGRLFLQTEFGPGLVDSQDTAQFAERLVDARGLQLDEHGLGRWSRSEGGAFVETDGLGLRHDDGGRVPLAHVAAGRWAESFGFVAQPGGGRIS